VLSIAVAGSSWIALAGGAGAAVEAKKKKLKCPQGDAAIEQIEPLFDANANLENTLEERLAVVQFGQLPEVEEQMNLVDANNPASDTRADPISNIEFLDKVSATGTLTIRFGESTLEQGTQYFMCVGKGQNGTKKGAWRITLYSLCSLYILNPCEDLLVNKAVESLSDPLLELVTADEAG
jgi:hypothetical protein